MTYQWTPEIEQEIFDRMAKGQAVHIICRADDWMPSEATFYRRLDKDPEFCEKYLRARERQADRIFEECLGIADSQEGDIIIVDGREVPNHDLVQRAKLRIDTRMRMAGKLKPKVYGDKLDLAVTAAPQDEEALDARIAAKLAAMASR